MDHREVESYRLIALLRIMSKLFEKLFLKRLKEVVDKVQFKPTDQLGFRNKHSPIDQVHQVTDVIEKSLERNSICPTIFFFIIQAFGRVWYKGLLHKLKSKQFYLLLKSYLTDRRFRIQQEIARKLT